MVQVLGIPFFDQDIDAAVARVLQVCKDTSEAARNAPFSGAALRPNHCISASGAHGLVEAHNDPAFKNILQKELISKTLNSSIAKIKYGFYIGFYISFEFY